MARAKRAKTTAVTPGEVNGVADIDVECGGGVGDIGPEAMDGKEDDDGDGAEAAEAAVAAVVSVVAAEAVVTAVASMKLVQPVPCVNNGKDLGKSYILPPSPPNSVSRPMRRSDST